MAYNASLGIFAFGINPARAYAPGGLPTSFSAVPRGEGPARRGASAALRFTWAHRAFRRRTSATGTAGKERTLRRHSFLKKGVSCLASVAMATMDWQP